MVHCRLRRQVFGALHDDFTVTSFEDRELENDRTYYYAVSNAILSGYLNGAPAPGVAEERLTPRQRQVLQLIAEGQSNKDIASLLALSVKGVEKHRSDLMKRLDLHNTAGLVMYAVKTGIVKAA